ncbi:hypothetical protein LBMAG53_35380 [Planctomycetota bacterium]|nr:hypothetical protein LBMAG53_35380 [Planctomycetota bacterium]
MPRVALVLVGALTCATADEAITASLASFVQIRAQISQADQADGSPYSVGGAVPGKDDHADFFLRRARFGVRFGTASKSWSGTFLLTADGADREGASRTPALFLTFLSRNFTDGDTRHSVQGGLDWAFINRSAVGPNTCSLLATQRATRALLNQRGTGIGYRLASPTVRGGIDIQNNVADSAPGSINRREGLLYCARIELTPPQSTGWNLDKYQESWAGAAGQGTMFTLDAAWNQGDLSAATLSDQDSNAFADASGTVPTSITGDTTTNTFCLGAEALVRRDGFVALAEIRWQRRFVRTDTNSVNGVAGSNRHARREVSSLIWLIQAGYTVQSDAISPGSAFEASARYSAIDLSREDTGETAAFGNQDHGTSGRQIEIGLTYHDDQSASTNARGNRTGFVYTNWHAEAGRASAHIWRLQQQISF